MLYNVKVAGSGFPEAFVLSSESPFQNFSFYQHSSLLPLRNDWCACRSLPVHVSSGGGGVCLVHLSLWERGFFMFCISPIKIQSNYVLIPLAFHKLGVQLNIRCWSSNVFPAFTPRVISLRRQKIFSTLLGKAYKLFWTDISVGKMSKLFC